MNFTYDLSKSRPLSAFCDDIRCGRQVPDSTPAGMDEVKWCARYQRMKVELVAGKRQLAIQPMAIDMECVDALAIEVGVAQALEGLIRASTKSCGLSCIT